MKLNSVFKLIVITLIVFLFALISGCSTALKSDIDPNVDISNFKTFYVQKFVPDGRGLEKIIASKLNELGYHATSGLASQSPNKVDVIVTYRDHWMWDITMYMLEIDIQFHYPDNDYIFATGNSYRTSLVRKTPEYMIEEVLRTMLGKLPMPREIKADNGGEL